MTPCDCSPAPPRSHLEKLDGAQVVHVTDEAGTWHGVQVGEQFHRVALIAPTAEYLEARAEPIADRQERDRRAQLRELARRRGLTLAEIQEALGLLL